MGTLAAGLIAAMIFAILTPYARAKPERSAEEEPGNVAHVMGIQERKMGTVFSAHDLLAVAAGTDQPSHGMGDHLPEGNSAQIPKTAQKAGEMPRGASAPLAENELEEAPPPPREKAPPSQAAALPPLGSCDDPLALVDRSHPLPQDYAPTDMVYLGYYGVSTLRDGTMLRREAAENLVRLMEAASAVGEDLIVASAYRSYDDQEAIHAELTNFHGEEAANRISAPPGHSEHQLGTTVDFTNDEAQYRVWTAFESTSAYGWLLEHAGDYGFVQSYEKGKEEETGYQAESWHYRYVGMDNARRLKDTGLSLQAFLVREGILPHCE